MEVSFRKTVMLLRSTSPLSFSEVCKEEILKDTLNLDTSKTCQDTDVPTMSYQRKCRYICRISTFKL